MRDRILLGAVILLGACAGKYAAATNGQTSVSPQETFECVRRQLTNLRYKQSSYDVDERRVTGNNYDTEARRADVQFRRLVNRLEVQVAPDAGGQTSINVQSRTFAEYTTQRGPTEVEEKPSSEVREAAQKLLAACGG